MEPTNIIRFLHNLFTALWMGGILTMALVIVPGVKQNKKVKQPWDIIESIQRRLKPIAIISMIVLAVTGMMLGKTSDNFTGLFNFASPYMMAVSIKHILIVLMILVAFYRLYVNKQISNNKKKEKQTLSGVLLMSNAVMAVAVIFLSSII